MLHAESILPYSSNFDSKPIINRYTSLIEDLLSEFKKRQLDVASWAIHKRFPRGISYNIIDDIISYSKFNIDGRSYTFDRYIEYRISKFNLNEQLFILSQADLLSVDPTDMWPPAECLSWLVFRTIRGLLVKSNNTR